MKINRSGNPNLDPRSWDKLKIRRGWGGFWEAYINGIGPLEHRLFKEECLDKVIAMHAGGDRDRVRPRPRGAATPVGQGSCFQTSDKAGS